MYLSLSLSLSLYIYIYIYIYVYIYMYIWGRLINWWFSVMTGKNVFWGQGGILFWNNVKNMVCVGHPPKWIMLDEAIMGSAPDFFFLRNGPQKTAKVMQIALQTKNRGYRQSATSGLMNPLQSPREFRFCTLFSPKGAFLRFSVFAGPAEPILFPP